MIKYFLCKSLNTAIFFEVGVKLGLQGLHLSPLITFFFSLMVHVLECEHHENRCIFVTVSMIIIITSPGSSTVPGPGQALIEHLIKGKKMDRFDYLLPESMTELIFYL